MKKNILIAFLLGFPFSLLQAQAVMPVTAKLQQATVYLQGASLTHSASAVLRNGVQELTIEGLSPEIDLNSLKVNCGHNSTLVSSIEFSTDYMTVKTEAARLQKLRDSLSFYQKQLQTVKNELQVNNKLLKTLSDGLAQNTQQKEKILSANELTACMDLYKAKAPQIQKSIDEGNAQQEKLNKHIQRIQAQIRQDESNERLRSGILRITVSSPINTVEQFTIRYFTPKASWTPCYDIQVSAIHQPVSLQAKAQVRQMTGLEWTEVKLSLSNARPNFASNAPVFSTWFLRFNQGFGKSMTLSNTLVRAKGTVAEETDAAYDEGAATYESAQKTATQATSTVFLLNGVSISREEYNSLNPSYIESVEILDAEQAAKTYGRKAITYVVRTKSMEDYVELQDSDLDISYQIELPYTIAGNGKAQLIDLKKYSIPTAFHYYAAPKLAAKTYLMATLSKWEKYHLLPGTATINYNGTYVGKTQLKTGTTDTALVLTLADEPRITVKREKRSEYTSAKTIGGNVTETRSHLITVKNNLNKKAPFTLKEQYPISTDKEIEVKLVEHTPAASLNNSSIGVLTWEMELDAGESRTFIVTYSVKYPKDRPLVLE